MDYSVDYEDLIGAYDDEIILYFLKPMIDDGNLWPDLFLQDVDVFNKNPREVYNSKNPFFVFVDSRKETCGTTDGCKSGCWRIMGRDQLIKSEDTGKILGFKKIHKFCEKTKPREYKRSWIMEEYRAVKKWNGKQNKVICKIRLTFESEFSFLLSKHFSYLYTSSSFPYRAKDFLPRYDICLPNPPEDAYYVRGAMVNPQISDPFLTNKDFYCMEPWRYMSLDQGLSDRGECFFVNRTETCGRTDGCDRGCWRIVGRDRLIKSETGKILGFKRVFKFCEKPKLRYYYKCGNREVDVIAIWTMEEYRSAKKEKQDKVVCKIRVLSLMELNRLVRK